MKLVLALVLLVGCKEETPTDLAAKMRQMHAMSKMQPEVNPVPYQKLAVLLPEKAAGFERKRSSGERSTAMSVKLSHAQASYEGEDGETIQIEVSDLGTMKGFAEMAAIGISAVEMEREDDDGFERTFEHRGHRAYEKYESATKKSEVKAIVANRFVVELSGQDIELRRLKRALEAIDLDALEAMKDEGIGSQ